MAENNRSKRNLQHVFVVRTNVFLSYKKYMAYYRKKSFPISVAYRIFRICDRTLYGKKGNREGFVKAVPCMMVKIYFKEPGQHGGIQGYVMEITKMSNFWMNIGFEMDNMEGESIMKMHTLQEIITDKVNDIKCE